METNAILVIMIVISPSTVETVLPGALNIALQQIFIFEYITKLKAKAIIYLVQSGICFWQASEIVRDSPISSLSNKRLKIQGKYVFQAA